MYRLIIVLCLLSSSYCLRQWDHNHEHHHNHGRGHHRDHDHGDWDEHGDWNDNDHDHGDWDEHGDWGDHDHGDWGNNDDHSGCHHHKHQHEQTSDERNFERISRYIIAADKRAKKFCMNLSNSEVQELYGNTSYKLIYTVPSSHVNNITVKIKHRVMYMRAQQLNVENPKTFVDVRILPNILKTSDAWWQYGEEHVIINIPYNVQLEAVAKPECANINETVIPVQNNPFLTYRFPIQ